MSKLPWWMRLVGGFYCLLGLLNLPPIVAVRLDITYPPLDVRQTASPHRR